LSPNEAEIVVLPDEDAIARESARRIVELLAGAVAGRGVAHIALTGGSSAVRLYEVLAQPHNRAALDWRLVHLWWGDDRFVPLDHPESNAGMAYRLLLESPARAGEAGAGRQAGDAADADVPGLPIDPGKVHPIEVEAALGDGAPIELAARLYAREIERWLPTNESAAPIFDVLLTGIGPDGHIMSIFPGSPALADDAPIVMGVPAPEHVEPHLPRVTLSARVLAPAGRILVMAGGVAKADIIARILGPERDAMRWPAQAVLLANATWLLDEAAASRVGHA
jgi:6-phosphogluconolactonase